MAVSELAIIRQGPKSYQFSTSFDGERYYLLLNYNDRNDTWYLDVQDANLETLISGLPALTNVKGMTFRFKIPNLFLFGDLVISDSSNNGLDPGYDTFGDAISMFYASILA